MELSTTNIKQESKFKIDPVKIIYSSMLMQDIMQKIMTLAKMESPIILVGETGTGKKDLARLIHQNSSRAHYSFHTFCCIGIDEEKYKEAFWGHLEFEQGRLMLRYDLLEKTERGTLFLDHFSEIPLELMDEVIISHFKGCNQLFRYSIESRPRLILSVSQKWYHDILMTKLGENLLALLNPFVLIYPPLRERKEDIPHLISLLLDEIRQQNEKWKDVRISPDALDECVRYCWPGNIQQLKSALLQGTILSHGNTIERDHLLFMHKSQSECEK